MKVYVTHIYNRKALTPFTLQFFEEEIDGFQNLGRKLGINPTNLVKKLSRLAYRWLWHRSKNNKPKPSEVGHEYTGKS